MWLSIAQNRIGAYGNQSGSNHEAHELGCHVQSFVSWGRIEVLLSFSSDAVAGSLIEAPVLRCCRSWTPTFSWTRSWRS
eukprot:scaffold71535_cov32-Prasinocladus_malaysianus.AAC.3